MQRFNLLLALLLLLPVAAAQDEVIEETPEIRRYTVEIIVFAYVEDVSVGTEIFPADIPLSVDVDALDDSAEDMLEDDALVEDEPEPEPEPVVDDEEAEEVREVLGDGATITGFYSYGEMSPFNENVNCALHNQTMTITTFYEEPAMS